MTDELSRVHGLGDKSLGKLSQLRVGGIAKTENLAGVLEVFLDNPLRLIFDSRLREKVTIEGPMGNQLRLVVVPDIESYSIQERTTVSVSDAVVYRDIPRET